MAAVRVAKGRERGAVSRGEMGSKSAIMSNDVPRKAAWHSRPGSVLIGRPLKSEGGFRKNRQKEQKHLNVNGRGKNLTPVLTSYTRGPNGVSVTTLHSFYCPPPPCPPSNAWQSVKTLSRCRKRQATSHAECRLHEKARASLSART